MKYKFYLLASLILGIGLFVGWGANGHKKINRNAYLSYNNAMTYFLSWTDSLALHAPDADNRKNQDSTESRRHYIDIDSYSDFLQTGRIPQTLDSLYARYGWQTVTDNGIVPFAVIMWEDSLKNAFLQHNWRKAMLLTADLGHYIGDMHQPLHITKYYDGRPVSNGIHSRYETQMFNRDSALIQYNGDSLYYIQNLNQFVFNWLYQNYKYVDSVLIADSIAYATTGSHSSPAYYQMLWDATKNFTIKLFKESSNRLTLILYKAWVDAGSPLPNVGIISSGDEIPDNFELYQNYPNPFNPSTQIKFDINKAGNYILNVYDIRGRLLETESGYYIPGQYEMKFDGSRYSSGIYIYALKNEFILKSKFMILTK